MAKVDTKGSRWVYSSGASATDRANVPDQPSSTVGVGTDSKVHQLNSVAEPKPSQKYTFQRGLAKAALELPEGERISALAETLAMMGLLERVAPRVG